MYTAFIKANLSSTHRKTYLGETELPLETIAE
jgi:hypothetical protein